MPDERTDKTEPNPGLQARMEDLSVRLGLANPPRLALRDAAEPNASYSPASDTLRINSGSLAMLDEREQNSEIAHELGHAKDWREQTYSPSRREREFRADAWAVMATGDPDARISGLKKIEYAKEHDRAVMQEKIAEKFGIRAAKIYGSLPEPLQAVVQESAFHGQRLLRRLHIDKHPLPEERYRRIEAMRAQLASSPQER